jgi:hypothetical protein
MSYRGQRYGEEIQIMAGTLLQIQVSQKNEYARQTR